MISMYHTALCLVMNEPVFQLGCELSEGRDAFLPAVTMECSILRKFTGQVKGMGSRGSPHRFTSCLLFYENLSKLFNLSVL